MKKIIILASAIAVLSTGIVLSSSVKKAEVAKPGFDAQKDKAPSLNAVSQAD